MPANQTTAVAPELVVVGGSAGSFTVISAILEALPVTFPLPLVLCLHRLKDKREGFKEALETKSLLPIREPEDKEMIEKGVVYIAPANYHLLIESKTRFALSITELVQYSRPSIDVLFESAADVFGPQLVGILLSGANRDGAGGVRQIHNKKGFTIVQNPGSSIMPTMPQAALELTPSALKLNLSEIIHFLITLAQ